MALKHNNRTSPCVLLIKLRKFQTELMCGLDKSLKIPIDTRAEWVERVAVAKETSVMVFRLPFFFLVDDFNHYNDVRFLSPKWLLGKTFVAIFDCQ